MIRSKVTNRNESSQPSSDKAPGAHHRHQLPSHDDSKENRSSEGRGRSLHMGQKLGQTLGIVSFTLVCIMLSLYILPPAWKLSRVRYSGLVKGGTQEQQTLKFDVCNGMSNQRLSMLYGVILAYELGRTPVLPSFLLSGVQWTAENSVSGVKIPMEDIYDVAHFRDSLELVGISTLTDQEAPRNSQYVQASIIKMVDLVEDLARFRGSKHLKVGCPLFKLPPSYFTGANSRIMLKTLQGLRPAPRIQSTVAKIVKELRARSPMKRFNFLHLRVEQDWVLHCERNYSAKKIEQVLQSLHVKNEDPIYVASFWEQVDPATERLLLDRMKVAGYKVVTSRDFKLTLSGDREANSTRINYIDRNPLQNPEWDYMVKAAVKSALHYHSVMPFCIWLGNISSPIFNWMADLGVTFIFHEPTWGNDLWRRVQSQFAPQDSYTYQSQNNLVSIFIRMDLPVIPELEQYIYVLYTDPDVFFNKRVSVTSFDLPLPEILGLAQDQASPNGVDGGVMLVNLPAARQSYQPSSSGLSTAATTTAAAAATSSTNHTADTGWLGVPDAE
eukprot:gene7680-840_t